MQLCTRLRENRNCVHLVNFHLILNELLVSFTQRIAGLTEEANVKFVHCQEENKVSVNK